MWEARENVLNIWIVGNVMGYESLKDPMLSVTNVLSDESSCCVKQGRCFMKKVHELFDKVGYSKPKDNNDVAMEVILDSDIRYDEL